jgi:hypothetical protein
MPFAISIPTQQVGLFSALSSLLKMPKIRESKSGKGLSVLVLYVMPFAACS